MIDTHAHLQSDQFEQDLEEVINRCIENKIEKVIIPAIELKDFEVLENLSNKYDFIYHSKGIHPHNAKDVDENTYLEIEKSSSANKCVAIGEIGLDYYYDFAPKDKQKEVFTRQLQIAKKVNLPVIVHNRESDEDLLEIINQEQDGNLNGVLHCFSSTLEVLKKALDLNFNVSFTGNITFKKSELGEIVKYVPNDRFMIETDSPYMAPVPHRGKRNEPSYVKLVAEKIAELKNISIIEVIKMSSENANKLFKLTLFLLMFSFAFANLSAQSDEEYDEEYEEEEIVENPFKKFIGFGPILGINTNVQSGTAIEGPLTAQHPTLKAGDDLSRISFEGLLGFGGSLYYSPIDILILEATYLYSKNTKISELNVGVAPTINNFFELSSNWLANPNKRVNFYGTVGLLYINNSINNVDFTRTGMCLGLGFLFNIPIKGVGLLNVNASWRINVEFGQTPNTIESDKNTWGRIRGPLDMEYTQFYSIPRFSLIFYPNL